MNFVRYYLYKVNFGLDDRYLLLGLHNGFFPVVVRLMVGVKLGAGALVKTVGSFLECIKLVGHDSD